MSVMEIFVSHYGFIHNLRRIGFAGAYVFLGLVILYQPLPTLASALSTTGHFEVYCDGVGLFLAKIDGAPARRNLLSFLIWVFREALSAGSSSDRGSGPMFMSIVMGASPTASARTSPMPMYG